MVTVDRFSFIHSGSSASLLVPFPGQKDCGTKGSPALKEGSCGSIFDGSLHQHRYHHVTWTHAEEKVGRHSIKVKRSSARGLEEPVQTMACRSSCQLLFCSPSVSSSGHCLRRLLLEHLSGQCLAKWRQEENWIECALKSEKIILKNF